MKSIFQKLLMILALAFSYNEIQAQCKSLFMFSVNGTTVNFYDSSSVSSGNTTYTWNFGDGTSSTLRNPQHAFNSYSTYNVCLIISDSNCYDTSCQSISLSNTGNCQAGFTLNLSHDTLQVINQSTGTLSTTIYSWDFGDGKYAYTKNANHIYSQPGQYNVCLSIFDSANQCSDQKCVQINVSLNNSNCHASFQDSSVNNSNQVYFFSTSTGTSANTSYSWSFGDSTTSSSMNPQHTYPGPGQYYVCLTISDSNCSDTYCSYITVSGASSGCQANFTYTVKGKTVTFYNNSTGSGNMNSVWSLGNGTSSTTNNNASFTHTYSSYGNFSVCLIIYTNNCADTVCHSVNIPFQALVSGTVSLGNTAVAAYPSIVWTIVYDTANGGTLTAIDSTITDSSGNYQFYLKPGDYLLKAALIDSNSSNYKNYLPTYHYNQLRWDTANLLTVAKDTTGIHIHLLGGNNPGGPGFIGGKVSQGANKTDNVGDPLEGIYIYITDDKQNPIAYTYSDKNGNYSFNNLALGSYIVYGDMPGKKTFELKVTLSTQNPTSKSINVEVNKQSIVIQNGIEPMKADLTLKGISVYPIPTSEYIYIQLDHNQKLQAEIFDITGKSIKVFNCNEAMNKVDVSTFESGMYLIRLVDHTGKSSAIRILKQ